MNCLFNELNVQQMMNHTQGRVNYRGEGGSVNCPRSIHYYTLVPTTYKTNEKRQYNFYFIIIIIINIFNILLVNIINIFFNSYEISLNTPI